MGDGELERAAGSHRSHSGAVIVNSQLPTLSDVEGLEARDVDARVELAARFLYPLYVKRLRVGVLYGGRSGEHEVSLASAAAVFAHLDKKRYEAVPIRIEKDGRWCLADRAPTAMSASDVIEQARLDAARPLRSGREVHMIARPSEETVLSIDRSASRARRARARDRHRPQSRRDLSGPARPLRRGRHRPGPAGARQRSVCRRRRARVRGRDGQGDHEAGLLGAWPAGRPLPRRDAARARGERRGHARRAGVRPRLPDVRQTGESRIERRDLEGQDPRRPLEGPRPRRRLRPQDRRRGRDSRGARDRVRGARQRHPGSLGRR